MGLKKTTKPNPNPIYKQTVNRNYSHVISHGHVVSKYIMDMDKDTK